MAVKEGTLDDLVREFFDSFGGEAGVREIYNTAVGGYEYLDSHRETLTARYPDEWIALRRDQVVGHAPSLDDLSRTLTREGVDRRGLIFHLMETEPRTLLL